MWTEWSCKRKSCEREKSLSDGRRMIRVNIGEGSIFPLAWRMLGKAQGDRKQG